MHQYHIRFVFCKDLLQALQDITGYVGNVLARLHDIQVVIRLDCKQFQYLIEHLPVLCGYTDAVVEQFWVFGESFTTGAILMASGRVPKTERIFFFTIENLVLMRYDNQGRSWLHSVRLHVYKYIVPRA